MSTNNKTKTKTKSDSVKNSKLYSERSHNPKRPTTNFIPNPESEKTKINTNKDTYFNPIRPTTNFIPNPK